MKITLIGAPTKDDNGRIAGWSGIAANGKEKYEWFYWPRRRFRVMKQERVIPSSWVYVDPPKGLKRAVLKTVRAARRAF